MRFSPATFGKHFAAPLKSVAGFTFVTRAGSTGAWLLCSIRITMSCGWRQGELQARGNHRRGRRVDHLRAAPDKTFRDTWSVDREVWLRAARKRARHVGRLTGASGELVYRSAPGARRLCRTIGRPGKGRAALQDHDGDRIR